MKIRKQTYSLDMYLKQLKAETIRTDQDVQRLSGQWKPNMVGELLYTVLTENYIPPIILGEETVNGIVRQWLIDGLQRSTSLSLFRYANTKIAKSIDEYMVTYQRKILDGDGNAKRDEKGEIMWESVECDVRGKSYSQLPEELRDRFDGYQIECVIHQDCEATEISKLVRRFNNHTAMNTAQKAFTYADEFAPEIRNIAKNRFFLDIYTCSRNDKKNGTVERIVGETALLCNYPDMYKKDTKTSFRLLNENASLSDFDNLNDLLTRLTASVETTTEIRGLFNSKNAHIFITAFKTFLEMGHEEKEYGRFLQWFASTGNQITIDEKSWETWNTNKSTRDTTVVRGKIDYITALFGKYFAEIRKAA